MASDREESWLVSSDAHCMNPTFNIVQNFLDFPAAYRFRSCSRRVGILLDELYEFSARRRALIERIPPYVAFRWRLPCEVEAIQQRISTSLQTQTATRGHVGANSKRVPAANSVPEVPPEILKEASAVVIDPLPEASAEKEARVQAGAGKGGKKSLTAMEQAWLTFCFVQGLKTYEAREMADSARWLRQALAMAPEDDILSARLADTLLAQYQAAKENLSTDPSARNTQHVLVEDLRQETLNLYRKAVMDNPSSSYGFNGLSLFQESPTEKKKYLLRAVALDGQNSYALVNLAIHLSNSADSLNIELYQTCLALLRRGLAINPNLFYARTTIVQLHMQMGQFEEGYDMLVEHVQRRPDDQRMQGLLRHLTPRIDHLRVLNAAEARRNENR